MFLPSVERYSTVALAPTASLPSTVVLSSTRNCTVLASLFFATCTENSASPTDVICPDNDWLSGVGSRGPAAGWAAGGVDQAAIVKQTRNSVARHREARNRMVVSSNLTWTGMQASCTNKTKAEESSIFRATACEIKYLRAGTRKCFAYHQVLAP